MLHGLIGGTVGELLVSDSVPLHWSAEMPVWPDREALSPKKSKSNQWML